MCSSTTHLLYIGLHRVRILSIRMLADLNLVTFYVTQSRVTDTTSITDGCFSHVWSNLCYFPFVLHCNI